jgi:NADH-quinone oxidoreductase subunit D
MTIDQDLVRHLADAQVSVELETEDMTLNIGPQHPSTHGVLRLVVSVSGERVYDIKPVLGYMHPNEVPFIVAAEKLMEIEVPERAQYIRLILTEMARISSHLMFLAAYPLELGAGTPLFFALRERERVLDLVEGVTGGRFHPNFNRIGGVKPAAGSGSATRKQIQDLPVGFFDEARVAMDKVLSVCDEIENLVAGNEIILARTKGIGILPPEVGAAYGVSGPNLRASGVAFDLRRTEDYLPYDGFDFEVPVGENGDSWDRWWVRFRETQEAAKIVKQAIDGIPSGPLQAKVPKIIKVPKGETYVRAENPKGEMGYYLVSDGGGGPYRLKIRSASFSNISILPWILDGVLVPDIIAIMGSLDFVLGDVDR